MGMVRVYNDNVYDYSEQFRDKEIKIKAKGFIEMEEGDAVSFKGSFAPIQLDADGNPTPASYKMIRIDRSKAPPKEPEAKKDVCQACAYEAANEKDLSEHVKAEHADSVLVDETIEQEIAAKKRGRPPKSA